MSTSDGNTHGATLIDGLLQARCYPHPVTGIQRLETHISWILLTGEYAYKIKKPVNLGFLDFSTLEQRRQCCEEELRLNRRLAPQLYLDIIPITGSSASPRVGGTGPVIEYAVKMRQFPQASLASALLTAGQLTPQHLEQLAATLAAFHSSAAASGPYSPYGAPQAMLDVALQNFDPLSPLLTVPGESAALAALRRWTQHEYGARKTLMEQRRIAGAVREGHGDLHLGNIVLIEDRLVPFDCIEFNPELRWNDVIGEAAFPVMDLHDRGHPRLAWLFLNAYLECSGDYSGIALLPFFLVYRAMVRAKIHGLRAAQPGIDDNTRTALLDAGRTYLKLAETFTRRPVPVLMITHGLSGSGKSRIAGELMQQHGAIRIRSDIERKRQHGLAPQDRSSGQVGCGIYDDRATEHLYQHLAGLARQIVASDHSVIIDAAFLRRWQRRLLRNTARDAGVPFLIVSVTASAAVLRERIAQRVIMDTDPSDAGTGVLEHQLATQETLDSEEREVAAELSNESISPDACCRQALDTLSALPQASKKPG